MGGQWHELKGMKVKGLAEAACMRLHHLPLFFNRRTPPSSPGLSLQAVALTSENAMRAQVEVSTSLNTGPLYIKKKKAKSLTSENAMRAPR